MNSPHKNTTISPIVSNTATTNASTVVSTSNPKLNDNILNNNNDSLIVNNNKNNSRINNSSNLDNSLKSAYSQQQIRLPKFPGFAKQSNVDEKDKLLQTTDILNNRPSVGSSNMSSFQRFSASCEDAWDSKIEDKISFENERAPYPNSRQKYGSRFGNIHIIEKANSLEPLNRNLHQESLVADVRQTHPFAYNTLNTNSISIPLIETSHEISLSNTNNLHNSDNDDDSDPRSLKLKKLLYDDECCNMNELRKLTWVGVPWKHRPAAWKLLIGLVPAIKAKRESVLLNRSLDYRNLIEQYYNSKSENDDIYRQIHIDIPRMQPLLSLFQQQVVQEIFERILYIWSIRHPASGYVQGMNDLVTPFFVTYLSEHVPGNSFEDVESFNLSSLSQSVLDSIESNSYWSFSKLLDSIQDNYTFAQPGIQKLVRQLEVVVSRVDHPLHAHLLENGVEYLQFAFRWMNNLLIREIHLRCIIRLWDTYLSEGAINATFVPSSSVSSVGNDSSDLLTNITWSIDSGTPFSTSFHLFVCAAFLRYWSKSLLLEKDFQGLMLKLQNLPTYHWSEKEVKFLVADAYQMKSQFSPNHLKV